VGLDKPIDRLFKGQGQRIDQRLVIDE